MAEEIDRIRIVVEPDSSGFQKDLETDLSKVKVDYEVPIDIDTTAAKVSVEKFRKDNDKPLEIITKMDTTAAGVEIKKFVKDVEGREVEIPMDSDMTAAKLAYEKFATGVETDKKSMPVDADTRRAREAVERMARSISVPRIMPIFAKVSSKSLKSFESIAQASIGRVARIASTAFTGSVFAGAALGAATLFVTLRNGVAETLKLSQVSGQLNAAYVAIGANVKKATKATLDRAAAIESVTGIDEIAIAQAEKTLLVMGKQTPEAVGRATRAAVNLAAATANGVDPAVKLASVQVALSKALANPEKATKALALAGVVLSDKQKKIVESFVATGRSAKAQDFILKAVEKRAKGAAATYGTTLPGQLSRARDVFDDLSRTISQGLLKKVLPVFLQQAKELGPELERLGPKIGKALGDGAIVAIGGLRKFATFVKANLPQIKEIALGIVSVVTGALGVAKQLGKAGVALFQDVVDLFDKGDDKSSSFGETLQKVGKGLKKFSGFLKDNQKVAKIVVAVFAALATGVVVGPIIAGITAIVGAFSAIGGTATLVIAAVLAVGAAFAAAYAKSETFRNAIGSLLPILKSVFGIGVTIIKIFVEQSIGFFTALMQHISGIVDGVKLIMQGGFKNIVKGVIMVIVSFVKLVATVFNRVPKLVLAILKRFGPQVLTFFGNLFLKVITMVLKWGVNMLLFFSSIPGRILAAIGKLVGYLLGVGRRAIQSFAGAVSAGANRVITFMKRVPGRISAALGNAASALRAKGKDFLGGLLAGLKEKFEDVKDFVKKIAGIIKSLKGPIEVDRKLLVPEGKAIMSGFEKGIKEKWKPVSRMLGGIAGQISENFLDPTGLGRAILGIGGDSLSQADVDKLNSDIGHILVGEKPEGGGSFLDSISKILEKVGIAGQHKTSGLADTSHMADLLAKFFHITVGTLKAGHSKYVDGRPGVISQHFLGQAADMLGSNANLTKAATKLSYFVDKIYTQIIWLNKFWKNGAAGGYIGGHTDHMHVGWIPRRYGGRVGRNGRYEVNEGGRGELFVPDTPGFIMSHSRLQKLLGLQDRVRAIEAASSTPFGAGAAGAAGRQTTQHNRIDIKMEHNVPDASSVAAILNARLDSAMRNFAMAGGLA